MSDSPLRIPMNVKSVQLKESVANIVEKKKHPSYGTIQTGKELCKH